jgi:hypothetical protein
MQGPEFKANTAKRLKERKFKKIYEWAKRHSFFN